jgi:hypothetical protein
MDEQVTRFSGGMVAPQKWLDLLQPKLPNIPPDMIKHEVLSVVRDFCRIGGVWRDWLRPVEVDGLALEYGLVTGNPNTEAVATLAAYRASDQHQLAPVPPEMAGPPAFIRRGGLPLRFWQTQPDRIFVDPIPAPTEAGNFIVPYVVLAPLDLCAVPEWFLLDNQLAVVDGVLASLTNVPGPNYRPNDAAAYRRAYVAARNRARTRAQAGYTRAEPRLRVPYVARGSQR